MTIFILLILSVWALPTDGAVAKDEHGCELEGRTYAAGSRFAPNSCTTCECPLHGGVAECVTRECVQDQNCVQYSIQSDECCPTCVEVGCRHTDGKLFHQGEVIRNEACVRCYCPFGGGNPVCDVTSCPLSQCVDPVSVPGVCCPICPNGPNCQIGILTLPIGQSILVEGATCTCESFIDVDGIKRTLARCNKS
ncbi:cysteine-rich motor neuron 1 protein-like [Physella acuta]|uniref:cysteine-rich motor neuron 1 protein-like n=1 Tax=Physella acuta TaxID=109671 RepID=UPI0027DC3B9F|nr:cysteine-rich motor neuron 1 protein-like [Physella acuta]